MQTTVFTIPSWIQFSVPATKSLYTLKKAFTTKSIFLPTAAQLLIIDLVERLTRNFTRIYPRISQQKLYLHSHVH
jgi:hypothetical protein